MICQREDRTKFRLLRAACRAPAASPPDPGLRALAVGLHFLGAPYGAGTLEGRRREGLVVNLREMDCFTFLENAVVLGRVLWSREPSFSTYTASLRQVRYRGGVLRGYASRLHYFREWLLDNAGKGILRDVTGDLGGVACRKDIHFMTAHRDLYPALRSGETFRRMRSVERDLSKCPFFCLPKAAVASLESRIAPGDLVAVATGIEGLDVAHVGLAVPVEGRLHLLHASQRAGRVMVSPETLCDYLYGQETHAGIMVGRLL